MAFHLAAQRDSTLLMNEQILGGEKQLRSSHSLSCAPFSLDLFIPGSLGGPELQFLPKALLSHLFPLGFPVSHLKLTELVKSWRGKAA